MGYGCLFSSENSPRYVVLSFIPPQFHSTSEPKHSAVLQVISALLVNNPTIHGPFIILSLSFIYCVGKYSALENSISAGKHQHGKLCLESLLSHRNAKIHHFSLKCKEKAFTVRVIKVTQSACGASILEDTQNPTEHSPKQCLEVTMPRSGAGSGNLQRCLPTSTIL